MVARVIFGAKRANGDPSDCGRRVFRVRARASGERPELARSKSHSLVAGSEPVAPTHPFDVNSRALVVCSRCLDIRFSARYVTGVAPVKEFREEKRVMRRNRYVAPILALVLIVICAHPSKLAGQANRDALRMAMAKRIDEAKQGTGVVVRL